MQLSVWIIVKMTVFLKQIAKHTKKYILKELRKDVLDKLRIYTSWAQARHFQS